MCFFNLIKQISQLQNKVHDLQVSLGSLRSINSDLIRANNELVQKMATMGNPIYLTVPKNTLELKQTEISAKADIFDELYSQGYIKLVSKEGSQYLFCFNAIKQDMKLNIRKQHKKRWPPAKTTVQTAFENYGVEIVCIIYGSPFFCQGNVKIKGYA